MDSLLAGLRAAAEPTRLRLLALCARGELTVSELTQILGQSQPRVSRHLKLLCEAGLLDRFREGTWVFYRLADDGRGGALARSLIAMLPEGDGTIARDRARLAQVKSARAAAAAAYFRANAERWDEIRSLYVAESEVERALAGLLGDERIELLLDIGTGTGRMLELFGPRARRAIGIDLSHAMLTVARTNLDRAGLDHCQLRHGDMYDLPLASGSVDLAIIHQVLHYADDPQAAIVEAARVLRPGGRLLVVDFAAHDLEYLRERHRHRRLGFTDDEVIGWYRAAGLRAERGVTLAGDPLTVAIWPARRAAAENADGDAASAARDGERAA